MTPDWIKKLLAGGLPAVLDYGAQSPDGVQTATPERVAPADLADRENVNPLTAITGGNFAGIALLAGGAVAVYLLLRK